MLALAAMAYLLSGCVIVAGLAGQPQPPPSDSLIEFERENSRFQEQVKQIRTVAILPSDVGVYQIDAGDVREQIAEWSAQARNNVVTALENELRTKMKAVVKIVSEESLGQNKTRLEETRALYSTVLAMILLHTNPDFPRHFFEEKLKDFDYSLGTEVGKLANGADALLFLYAQDQVETTGRRAQRALGYVLYGTAVTLYLGVPILLEEITKRYQLHPPIIRVIGGGNGVRAALVDSGTGDILWINAVGSGAGTDLRDPASARAIVSELFKDFPVSYERPAKGQESR